MISRADNEKRARAGMKEDRNDGLFSQRKHAFGYNAISMQGLELGKPWRADEDPSHNCRDNGCKVGKHYVRPNEKG